MRVEVAGLAGKGIRIRIAAIGLGSGGARGISGVAIAIPVVVVAHRHFDAIAVAIAFPAAAAAGADQVVRAASQGRSVAVGSRDVPARPASVLRVIFEVDTIHAVRVLAIADRLAAA